jgi:hypothetical protein
MQDNVLSNTILEDAINSNKLESTIFNINKNNSKNKNITNRSVELIESDNSNNINNNINLTKNQQQQQQQSKTKKTIIEELQNRQQFNKLATEIILKQDMNRNQASNANTPSGMAKFGNNNVNYYYFLIFEF